VTVRTLPRTHLINVAALPCESQNTKTVILQIKLHQMYHSFVTVDHAVSVCLKFTYLVYYTALCGYETKIHEQYMYRYELHPRHLINVATLPCENRNTENACEQNCII